MDVKILLPFVEAITSVFPQFGFASISRNGLKMTKGTVVSKGVTVNISLIGMLAGSIVYNIDYESAKKIASHMMMGMPVNDFDDMAKSAVSELGNLLAANAAIALEKVGVKIDISPPNTLIGSDFVAQDDTKGIVVDMKIDDVFIEVNMLISSAV